MFGDERVSQGLFIVVFLDVVVQQFWDGEYYGQYLDVYIGEFVDEKDASTVAVGRDSLDDGNIAVDIDVKKQEYVVEEVYFVDVKDEFVNVDIEGLGFGCVVCLEGQGQEEEDVCYGQVEQVGISYGFEFFEIDVGQYDQFVVQQVQEVNDGVYDWEELGFKVSDIFFEVYRFIQCVVYRGVVVDVIVRDFILVQVYLRGRKQRNVIQFS